MSPRSVNLLIEDLWEAVEKVENDIPSFKQNLSVFRQKKA
jgi:hypothetical protein